ncbi:ABC transporter ATP-binding protein [Pararhizobium sp. IMCC21322]|uniref:ABC transporter ATP-binding protein n=1 Tax=Pararhizobium sp. IMCC21322 TaxID=3067903 RepID=UPI00274215A1|nr:ABC transporter ATP-binding protein [Pararhizobium sp. IMCC21322]
MAKTLGPVRCDFAPWNDPDAVPYISFQNVTKRFGDFTAVDDLSLDIYEREFFALLGPSGCGKTTMMRMLAGFDAPSSGNISLDGADLTGIPPYKRPVNMMFQSYALFPHMSVEKNIAFGLKQERIASSDVKVRVEEMLSLVKLEEFAKRKPHQLSGGQRQRVALARSLAKRPKVLLLDEPMGALDKKLREETQFELMDLQERLGMTFMIVTHDQEEAMTVADRIAVMDKGRIIQIATPTEIYEQPSSRYVADFIGDINLIEGRLTEFSEAGFTENLATMRCPGIGPNTETGLEIQVRCETTGDLAVGDHGWFAMRPEKIRLSHDVPEGIDPANPVNAVEGIIYDIAYLGDVSVFHVKINDDFIIRATQTNTTRSVERPLSWEDQVWLYWGADAGILLAS